MAAYRTSAAGGGTSGTGDRTCTITPAVGDLFLVFVAVKANTNNTPTCSDNNGGSYSLITGASLPFESSLSRFAAFVRTSLLANTTSTVVTAATGSNASGEVVVVAISGMLRTGTSAIRSSGTQSNQTSGGTPAPALSQSALTGNVTVGSVGNASNPANMTTPTNWTERQDVGQTNTPVGVHAVTRDSGFTGTTVTWGSTSPADFASIVLELDGSIPDLAADAGSFALSGGNLGLDLMVPMDAGTFALSGADLAFILDTPVPLDAGTFSLTGADLEITLAGGNPEIDADVGTFALTGADLGLDLMVPLETGSYALTGSDTGLDRGFRIDLDAGVFSMTGADADLIGSWNNTTVDLDAGTFALSGADAGLDRGFRIDLDTGVFTLSGADLSFDDGSGGDVDRLTWWKRLWLGLGLGV